MKKASIVLLFAVLAMGSQSVYAQPAKKVLVFTGTEVCYPQEFGQWSVLPSGNVKVREYVSVCYDTFPEAPQFTGRALVTMSCNLDKSWSGPCWGTWGEVPGDPPVWAGVWEGHLDFSHPLASGTFKLMGQGSGPADGLRWEGETIYDGADNQTAYVKIFNPKAR